MTSSIQCSGPKLICSIEAICWAKMTSWLCLFFDERFMVMIYHRPLLVGQVRLLGVLVRKGGISVKYSCFFLIQMNICYRPHPKDGKGNVFKGIRSHPRGYPGPRFFPRSLVPVPFLGVPQSLARTGLGYPPPDPGQDWGTTTPSETEQQSEYLLHGGRYASCGQAGELSCLKIIQVPV